MADGVRPIIDRAISGADQALSGNFIRLDSSNDKTAVKITMHVKGLDEHWIMYDVAHLDELIRMLQLAREDLR
jgi:hypothetical protein